MGLLDSMEPSDLILFLALTTMSGNFLVLKSSLMRLNKIPAFFLCEKIVLRATGTFIIELEWSVLKSQLLYYSGTSNKRTQ